LLGELNIPSSPPTIYYDNQGVVLLTANPILHSPPNTLNLKSIFIMFIIMSRGITLAINTYFYQTSICSSFLSFQHKLTALDL
ncbi:hypothetical protein VIGAN_03101400, partial [Vigna angularis var. angularis]